MVQSPIFSIILVRKSYFHTVVGLSHIQLYGHPRLIILFLVKKGVQNFIHHKDVVLDLLPSNESRLVVPDHVRHHQLAYWLAHWLGFCKLHCRERWAYIALYSLDTSPLESAPSLCDLDSIEACQSVRKL